ncbi:hypothetical protein QC762_100445 [Podospora pseudocomata]|uniref:Uncharacterized protein n=1 Tax=Podospora pseudocomata TaxID=2093779 RepID=A0ABR0GRG4_9PEZI|nr:hypothetical protein QC762_100445 [Podospora pseudocomata]
MQCESCHASDKQPAIAHLQQFGPFRVPSTRSRIYAFPIGSLPPHPEDRCGGDGWGRCDKIKGFTMNYKHTVPFSSHFSNSLLIFQAWHFAVHFGAGPGMRLYMPQGEHTSNLVMPRGVFGYDVDDRGA